MSVIDPGLFSVMQRFPECKDTLRQLYRTSESFQAICHNYKRCSKARDYWAESEHEEALSRQQEYAELIRELEQEIRQSLEEEV